MSAKEWAQLVCTTDINAQIIPIRGDKFTIGRAQSCDLSLPSNKLISGQHCEITRNNDGSTLLKDTSTNGTLINSSQRVSKGKEHKLQHGDEIFLVFRKDDKSKNVAYMFQDLSQLLDETLLNEERGACEESEGECTDEYEYQQVESDTRPTNAVMKRPATSADSGGAVPAKRHCDEQSQMVKPGAACHIRDSDTTSVALTDAVQGPGHTDIQPETDKPTVSTSVTTSNKTLPGITTVTSKAAVSGVNTPAGIGTAIGVTTATSQSAIGVVMAVDSPGEVPSASNGSESVPSYEGMAGTLVCSICQDIFHDCVSLQPCLHSFCAACYTSWMDISKECPTCRNNVERISRNFIVNNLVEAFVKEHPDKKRSEEETAEMDAKNKITRDMMTLPKKEQADVVEVFSISDDDMSGEDSDDHDENTFFSFRDHILNTFGPFGVRNQQPQRPPDPTCRQCPGYNGALSGVGSNNTPGTSTGVNSQVGTSTTGSAAPSTSQLGSSSGLPTNPNQPLSSTAAASSSDGSVTRGHRLKAIVGDSVLMPNAPPYQCLPGANHLMCSCCRSHMPDRRQEYFANPRAVPSQKCDICGNFFCHLYWGCEKFDCYGCLNKFGDLFFGKKCLGNLILKNAYESDILKSHLQRNNLTWKDVLQTCMTKLDSGEYSCEAGVVHRITSANTVCYHCGLKNFQELAYQYRKDIPRDQLPMHVVARPDCHWGSKCRTQVCKLHHATNFNHICEQTRF
ncbi:E3 ubiquitin-protein ligase CHFR-like [Asterias rubens]|uniref:E3 ubiquitin-protein ligase CHFR-like n=1 Tax=Asterias rubens TaxID=7604 RepID=UPI001455D41A|nr:E3 ubiquitin-protein ligase CHFR-like [Asterias rubens]XP_033627193.1 E3 ubiquitin-protein ligase CHFR-like [Asterias rubens]XP_033627194.1 E3 ubiquitin-protein ligase CHFR-like [Asterias rubens]